MKQKRYYLLSHFVKHLNINAQIICLFARVRRDATLSAILAENTDNIATCFIFNGYAYNSPVIDASIQLVCER